MNNENYPQSSKEDSSSLRERAHQLRFRLTGAAVLAGAIGLGSHYAADVVNVEKFDFLPDNHVDDPVNVPTIQPEEWDIQNDGNVTIKRELGDDSEISTYVVPLKR